MSGTPREELYARRNEYLERLAIKDRLDWPEQFDGRAAEVRRFRAGGDDTPSECLPPVQPGERRVRHRPPLYSRDKSPKRGSPRDEAMNRLESHRADESDYDHFSVGPNLQTGLYRIIALLVRAVERWHAGVPLSAADVFDVEVTALPRPAEGGRALPKAWTLLELCGFSLSLFRDRIEFMIKLADWSVDHWNRENSETKRKDPNAEADKFSVAMPEALINALNGYLDSYRAAMAVPLPKSPDPGPTPPPDDRDPCDCSPPPNQGNQAPKQPKPVELNLADTITLTADALLAATGSEVADEFVADLRALDFPDSLIARLLKWVDAAWSTVPDHQRLSVASWAWLQRHPLSQGYTGLDSASWERVPSVIYILRELARITRENVREACVQLASLVKSRLLAGWQVNTRGGDAAVWAQIDQYVLEGRRWVDEPGRDDIAFRIPAHWLDSETFDRVLRDGMRPAAEMARLYGSAALNLTSPGGAPTPLDAYYWRFVVLNGTFNNILALTDSADFGVAEHVRFLGFFRRGGKMRPALGQPGYNQEFENWIRTVVPDWFVDFATAAVLRFKFWVDDEPTPRSDEVEMTFWSENHQICFASSEYILGRWWPHETFPHLNRNSTRAGDWHRDRALIRLKGWLRDRLRFGFCEVNSPVYYKEHLSPLLNLVDFSADLSAEGIDDEEGRRVRELGLMVLDVITFDIVQRVCQGSFLSATSRAYFGNKSSGWGVSLRDFIEVLTGSLGDISDTKEDCAVSLATSAYLDEVPECLLLIGRSQNVPSVARTRTSISFDDAGRYGIGFESAEDIIFWWSHLAYFTDQTYRTSQSWSERWHLRKSGPFKLFGYIDGAVIRLVSAIVAGTETHALWLGMMVFFPSFVIFLVPRILRSLVDAVTAVLDVISAGFSAVGKALGLLDENDDRVRLAKPTVEHEFERLAIELNAGSVVERELLYVWRSQDAMLSSMVGEKKQQTSAQKQICIATLGPDVSVFFTRPLDVPGLGSSLARITAGAAIGLGENLEFWKTVPGSMDLGNNSVAPELSGVAYPIGIAAASSDLFSEGPNFWDGQVSNPLVWQYENVSIAIYKPTSHQCDISSKTHAHWPWDHFDEIATKERSGGGRWIFGRHDRRWPPRTPCKPRREWRPTQDPSGEDKDTFGPVFLGARRQEQNSGSGYVALFSAQPLTTTPADPDAPFSKDDEKDNDKGWGQRELIAEGDNNIWVMVVGDQGTFRDFGHFVRVVGESRLDFSVDDGRCSIELPWLSPPQRLEVSWDGGAKLSLLAPFAAAKELSTDEWPRFELKASTLSVGADAKLPFGVRGGPELSANAVKWDETRWKIWATVERPTLSKPGLRGDPQTTETVELSVTHDFQDLENPTRRVVNLPPSPEVRRVAWRPPKATENLGETISAQSRLGAQFREAHRSLFARSEGAK